VHTHIIVLQTGGILASCSVKVIDLFRIRPLESVFVTTVSRIGTHDRKKEEKSDYQNYKSPKPGVG
jgi:hypothetical protein